MDDQEKTEVPEIREYFKWTRKNGGIMVTAATVAKFLVERNVHANQQLVSQFANKFTIVNQDLSNYIDYYKKENPPSLAEENQATAAMCTTTIDPHTRRENQQGIMI